MKTQSFLPLFMLLLGTPLPLVAGDGAATAPPPMTERRDGIAFMEQNIGIMTSVNDKMTVDTLYGFTTGRGYQFRTTPCGSNDLYFLTGWFRGTQSVHGGEYNMHLMQELLPFFAGYRYTWRFSEQWSAYAGVHAGYVYSHATQKTSGTDEDGHFRQKLSTSSNSFACGASVGATWRFSRSWAATAGYSFTEMLPMKRFVNDDSYPRSSHALAGTAHIGLTMIFDDTAERRIRATERLWLVTGSLGMMHSNRGFVSNGDQWVTSDLYGASVTVTRKMAARGRLSQRLGFSTGYFSGDVTNSYGGDELHPVGVYSSSYSVHNEVDVIPLLVTWDWAWALRPTFTLRCGLVGGAIVRHMDFDLQVHEQFDPISGAPEQSNTGARTSSTRFLPTIGLRLGVEVRMNERSMMFIGYDFMQSFGKDSRAPSDPSGIYSDECANVPKRNRYFGLVTAGVAYRF